MSDDDRLSDMESRLEALRWEKHEQAGNGVNWTHESARGDRFVFVPYVNHDSFDGAMTEAENKIKRGPRVSECRVCNGKAYSSDPEYMCEVCSNEIAVLDLHPTQGIVEGRFRKNEIVSHLLDSHTIDMHDLVVDHSFSREDWIQFAQLIGYSVSGYLTLSYAVDLPGGDE